MKFANQNKYCIKIILQEEFIKNIDDIFNKLRKANEKIIQNIFICINEKYNHFLITNETKKNI